WNSCVVVSSSGGGRSQRRGLRGGRRPPGLGVAGGFCRRRGAANACVSTWRNDYENSAGLDPRASRHKCPCVRNECRKVLWIWWEGRGVWLLSGIALLCRRRAGILQVLQVATLGNSCHIGSP